jgi:hypothetical protein
MQWYSDHRAPIARIIYYKDAFAIEFNHGGWPTGRAEIQVCDAAGPRRSLR